MRNKLRPFLPFTLALLLTLVSAGIAWFAYLTMMVPFYLSFLPAIMFMSWYRGTKIGVFTSICAGICIYYLFLPEPYSFVHKQFLIAGIQVCLFMLEGGLISFFCDEKRRVEKISFFRQQSKEQQKQITALEEQLSHARAEIASRDEFLAIASHELKTPLTSVLLQIQTTLHNIRNVSLAEFSVAHLLQMLQSTQDQTKRLSKMINDLLNISLITTHKMELEREPVDLVTLVKDCVEDFAQKFEKEGGSLSFDAQGVILGEWDRLRLAQAVDNLLSNALKYGDKKPVKVEVKRNGKEAVIHVIDQGIGISPANSEKIFQLFTRGITEKDYKGLGVGLYITQQIVSMHGGVIGLKSRIGSGTTFTLHLPIQEVVVPQPSESLLG